MDDGLVRVLLLIKVLIKTVLILVVVDDGLVQGELIMLVEVTVSLNPCCSGRWSRTDKKYSYLRKRMVLILVVVDDGLVPPNPYLLWQQL